jgi:hypothetical protein
MAITRFAALGLIAGLGLCGLVPSACSPMFTCDHEVLRHIPSPDGKYEALLVKTACGATTRDTIWVTLNERGAPGIGHLAAVAENAPLARWTAARTLQLTPNGAPIFPKSLSWHRIHVDLVNGGKYGTPGETMVEWDGSYGDPEEPALNHGDSPRD